MGCSWNLNDQPTQGPEFWEKLFDRVDLPSWHLMLTAHYSAEVTEHSDSKAHTIPRQAARVLYLIKRSIKNQWIRGNVKFYGVDDQVH